MTYVAALAYANEGIIEKVSTFVERLMTSRAKVEKAIISLKGKQVKEQFTKPDGGKYSGLKLIDLDEVDGKSIIKYLELILKERDFCIKLCRKSLSQLQQVVKIYSKNIDENALKKLNKILEDIGQAYEEVREHSNESSKRKAISIKSPDQKEFDKIIQLIEVINENMEKR